MRSIFSICKIFSFCFFVVYLFSSCKSTITVSGGTEVKKRVTISIERFDKTTGKLKLKDEAGNPADTFNVWPGQIIKWKIKDKTIKSIDSMPAKPTFNKSDVFSKEPHKKVFCKTWKGVIKEDINFKEGDNIIIYDYNIAWTLKESKQPYTHDPRMLIHPR